MILREEMYFEPRVVSELGVIRWYGERYESDELMMNRESTVYIRDNSRELFIYKMDIDQLEDTKRIEAVFSLICRIQKHKRGYQYGRTVK